VNTKKEQNLRTNAMQKDHKENLNLMFYDFNHGALSNDMPLGSIIEEVPEPVMVVES
jgi:hypothetical protein